MPFPIIAGIAASLFGSILGANKQADAAENASQAQLQAAQLGIAEQRRQFNKSRKLLRPYVQAGNKSLRGVLALTGLRGNQAQNRAIRNIKRGPEFDQLVNAGENAILSNASATGGLRGGNTERALAEFRPQILSALIDKQLGRLGGLTGMGQQSAAGVGTNAMTMGNNITSLYQQQGAAQAGNYLAQGQAQANLFGDIAGGIGNVAGQYADYQQFGGAGGGPGTETFGQWMF